MKQKTLRDGTIVELHRVKNRSDLSGNPYQYEIRDSGGQLIEDPVFTKKKAMEKFNATVRQMEKGIEEETGEEKSIFDITDLKLGF